MEEWIREISEIDFATEEDSIQAGLQSRLESVEKQNIQSLLGIQTQTEKLRSDLQNLDVSLESLQTALEENLEVLETGRKPELERKNEKLKVLKNNQAALLEYINKHV